MSVNSKFHVLLIHQAFCTPGEAGGTRHFELGTRMAKQGHRLTVVASNLTYLTGKSAGGVSRQDLDGIRILRAYAYPALHRGFAGRVFSFLTFTLTSVWTGLGAGKMDMVMGTSPPIFQGISAWVIALLRRRPLLLEIRDLWPEFAVELGVLRNPFLIAVARCVEHFLYARASHIMVNSPAYRDYLLGKGIPSEKISVIANGVDVKAFSPAANGAEVRRAWNLDGKFVATYAGALGMANDIPVILKAADRLRRRTEIIFLLVGDGKERANLEAQAREMKLENVIFTGARPKSEMPEILAASDVCLATLRNIPMFSTTYPNKVFDYMAAGKLAILTIDGVIRKVIEDAKGGLFVPPGDDAQLAAAIERASRDRALVADMGRSAREYVVKRFDRDRQAEAFAALLERLATRAAAERNS